MTDGLLTMTKEQLQRRLLSSMFTFVLGWRIKSERETMARREVRFSAARILLALACAISFGMVSVRAQQQDMSKVEIQTVPVAEGIYVLLGVGGNIGVFTGADGVLLIDAQSAALHDKIMAAVAKVSGGKPLRFLVNTHDHADHTGGNALMAKEGAVIVAQDNLRTRLSAAPANLNAQPNPKEALPVITFDKRLTLHFNGEDIDLIHPAPAHTDNDTIVYFRKANVMHVGDLLGSRGYPPINLPGGFTMQGMIAAADEMLKMANADTKIITGHRGPIVTAKDLQAQRDLWITIRDRVRSAIRAGKTLAQVIAMKPTAEFDANQPAGRTPDEFVKGVYEDLSRKP